MKGVFSSALAVWLLASCSHVPRNTRPSVPRPAGMKKSMARSAGAIGGDNAKAENGSPKTLVRFSAGQPVERWWLSLNAPRLTVLIKRGLAHNADALSAMAALEAAQAQTRATKAGTRPQFTQTSGPSRQYISQEGQLFPVPKPNMDSYSIDHTFSWEADLFGRLKNTVAAAKETALARKADLRAAQVSVAAAVGSSYIRLLGTRHTLSTVQRSVENQQLTVRIVQKKVEAGAENMQSLASAKTQLELTRSTLPTLEADIQTEINRLATLCALPAPLLRKKLARDDASATLPQFPKSVRVGNASLLLRRRPDVARAEHELAASVARYKAKRAEIYPQIGISGNFGFSSLTFSNLLTKNAFNTLISPAITWNALDFGRLEALTKAADADAKQAAAAFKKAVLTALEESDSAARRFSAELKRRNMLGKAVADALQAEDLARARYQAGADDLLDLLNAQSSRLTAEKQLTSSEMQAELYLIDLYRALGGGWPTKAKKDKSQQKRASATTSKADLRKNAAARKVKQHDLLPPSL